MLNKLLNRISLQTLIVLAIFLAVAPVLPAPHLWQKITGLLAGEWNGLMDFVDIAFHVSPSILLYLKIRGGRKQD